MCTFAGLWKEAASGEHSQLRPALWRPDQACEKLKINGNGNSSGTTGLGHIVGAEAGDYRFYTFAFAGK